MNATSRFRALASLSGSSIFTTILVIFLILWLSGLSLHIGGALIHHLLVVTLVVLVFNLITGRRSARLQPGNKLELQAAAQNECMTFGRENPLIFSANRYGQIVLEMPKPGRASHYEENRYGTIAWSHIVACGFVRAGCGSHRTASSGLRAPGSAPGAGLRLDRRVPPL